MVVIKIMNVEKDCKKLFDTCHCRANFNLALLSTAGTGDHSVDIKI